jgi:hypothetical protein
MTAEVRWMEWSSPVGMILQCPGCAYPGAKGRDREAPTLTDLPKSLLPFVGWRGTGKPLGMPIALATKNTPQIVFPGN